MNDEPSLGRLTLQLLLYLGAGGLVTGFTGGVVVGALTGTDPLRLEGVPGFLVGGVLGLVVGVVCFLLARQTMVHFLRSGVEWLQDAPAEGTDGTVMGNPDPETNPFAMLAAERQTLRETRDRYRDQARLARQVMVQGEGSRETLEEQLHHLEGFCERLPARVEEITRAREEFDRLVKPIMDQQFRPVSPDGLDEFESIVEFQDDLTDRLGGLEERVSAIGPGLHALEEGAHTVRETVRQANEHLLELAELYREFPVEQLPQQAERLRQRTQQWDALADELDALRDGLKSTRESVRQGVEELHREAESAGGAAEAWNSLKDEVAFVDNKFEQIRQATQNEWVVALREQLEELSESARELGRSSRVLRDELGTAHERIHRLRDLVRQMADDTEETEHGRRRND